MSDIANQSNGNYGNHSNGNYSNQSNGNFANQSNGNFANQSNGNLQTVGSVLGAIQELLQNSDPDALIEPGLLNPQRRMRFEEKYCALCKKNGETREFYTTHVLKDNRGKVICPILRKYSCPKCGATGDNAHTLRHCPITRGTDQQSVMETIKTPRSSCGRRF
ncbi:hypothetical protein FSP39_021182 [Pinctada imbricata]|uniref:Nanos-type domain-containing protein n=1 Tax=Pinctada imbricata TaxID=66713 RepID=A0AA88YF84_PINIB|nr:hypothetical protein FSP39_021182 [Pinctada imbricata]